MRPSFPILFGLLASGLAAGLLLARLLEAPAAPGSQPALSPSLRVVEPPARVDAGNEQLAHELAALRARLERLERPDTRVAAEGEAQQSAAPEGPIPSADERAKILAVLDQRDEERAREKQRQRAEKQEAELRRRATRIADELGLATGSEQRIASILLAEYQKAALVREEYKGVGRGPEGRQAYKDALVATRSWRDEELGRYFGPEVAKEISALESGSGKGRKASGKRKSERGASPPK